VKTVAHWLPSTANTTSRSVTGADITTAEKPVLVGKEAKVIHMSSNYIVYIEAPPFPFRGYRLEALKIPKGKTFDNIKDNLPPCLISDVEVEANNITEAKALGLAKLINGD
jgi:hypothetical protein